LVVAAHEELVMPRVMTAVDDLVARQASGVLEITGNPSGAIYLDAGRIAFARASWVPGLVARLRAASPALAASGELLPSGGDGDAAAVAGLAVQRGYLTPGALHELIRSVVVDAFLVLTVPLTTDSTVSAIRFTSTRTYWTEMFPRFQLDLVRAEALGRAERMAEHGLGPTTPVQLRDLGAPSAVLTREQWALACQIGEPASALDLAARRGAGLADTIDCLGRLAQAGLCTPVRVPRREAHARGASWMTSVGPPAARPPLRPVSHPGQPPVRSVPSPVLPAPVTAEPPQFVLPARSSQNQFAGRPGIGHQPPPVDLLRQVLSGLRKL
jgi:hypothetical protein